MNKLGLNPDQVKKLETLLQMGQYLTAFGTLLMCDTLSTEEFNRMFHDIITFLREEFPGGPLQISALLNEISSFCDLTAISVPREIGTGKPL